MIIYCHVIHRLGLYVFVYIYMVHTHTRIYAIYWLEAVFPKQTTIQLQQEVLYSPNKIAIKRKFK